MSDQYSQIFDVMTNKEQKFPVKSQNPKNQRRMTNNRNHFDSATCKNTVVNIKNPMSEKMKVTRELRLLTYEIRLEN